ncbi:MAG TPA: tetratricopeptide repeat protein, partial [Polyangiaceae bacterium]|nr:tetratricopeptide repeat protein [Polyangiaceae bacterium]
MLGLLALAVVDVAVQLVRGTPEVFKRARLVADRARAKHRPRLAMLVSAECGKSECACAAGAGQVGLDLDLGSDVLALLEPELRPCADALGGIRAEALSRLARPEAVAEARAVLGRHPTDPHAHYALALASYRNGDALQALESAKSAIDAGRGAEAQLLAGLISLALGRLDAAENAFQTAAELAPDEPSAFYNLALIQHQRRHF